MGFVDWFTGKLFYLVMLILFGFLLLPVYDIWQLNPSTWNMAVLGMCVLGIVFGIYKLGDSFFKEKDETGTVEEIRL